MDEVLRQSLLYDFYGELLTEHQRTVYEAVVQDDLSYSEAAEMFDISRQGVHDLVKRCEKQMEEYESRLHLVERFQNIRESVLKLQELSADASGIDKTDFAHQVSELSERILEEL
ncbi:MAG: YlxM family DNA-binding protein [Lachnospiraceae bacterium]|nr:YlxM family DNA-binding protein [Lachnospiraceae bacterium]MCD7842989.1 YlxM family DNA-binding protein [Lachnospiraceae bacterium]